MKTIEMYTYRRSELFNAVMDWMMCEWKESKVHYNVTCDRKTGVVKVRIENLTQHDYNVLKGFRERIAA